MSERRVAQKKHTPVKKLKRPDINKLAEIFDNDFDLAQFIHAWLENGRNATQAYLKVFPDSCTPASASVLGHRMLRKVNVAEIMRLYGIDENKYFTQLDEGLGATRWNDFTGEREADHKTRLPYHDKVGRLLGVEREGSSQTNIQVNVLNKLEEQKKAYNLNE